MKEPRKKKLYVVVDVLCVLVGKFSAPQLCVKAVQHCRCQQEDANLCGEVVVLSELSALSLVSLEPFASTSGRFGLVLKG